MKRKNNQTQIKRLRRAGIRPAFKLGVYEPFEEGEPIIGWIEGEYYDTPADRRRMQSCIRRFNQLVENEPSATAVMHSVGINHQLLLVCLPNRY